MNKSKSTFIKTILTQQPNLSARDVANKVGADISLVYQIKKMFTAKKVLQVKNPTPLTTLIPTPLKVDMINSPPHYTKGGIETIDFIRAKLTDEQYKGYLLGNIIKYSSRMGLKGQEVQDSGKLHWYTRELEKSITGTGITK